MTISSNLEALTIVLAAKKTIEAVTPLIRLGSEVFDAENLIRSCPEKEIQVHRERNFQSNQWVDREMKVNRMSEMDESSR